MTQLLLVRHGQALCNVERTIEGVATCRGLSDLGHRQAGALAERMHHEGLRVDAIYASPIRRARETAAALERVLDRASITDARLEELRPGEAEGMTWDQYTAFFGNTEGWNPDVPFAPGAEAWFAFKQRVGEFLDEVIARHHGEKVLLVAHGGVVDASMFHFFGLDPQLQSPIDFETTNTSITEWERRTFSPENRPPVHRWRLCRYNDAAHLQRVTTS